ncbi:hypothetical protein [Caloranaerobacter azorensis]|uniref:Uncharacterized protein n=1 Tax=Caloranaerobacter azorensis TaxID=116090 RepID=A0A6P1YDT0_9FIRM|nr:hypothetical protein [Caloranaerobacter azorensis]QIB26968.1 hypothetical protein G3A45_06485 [Caloranaerobacter azorensis]
MRDSVDLSLETLIIFTNNFLPYPQENMFLWFVLYIIYFAPKLLALFILGDFFYEDFRICSVYVFTRKDNRVSWFTNKLFKMIKYILIYYVCITVIIAIVGVINGFNVDDVNNFLLIFISIVVLNGMVTLIFVLLTNILSLYTNAEISLVVTLLIYAVLHIPSFIKIDRLQDLIIKLSPALQSVIVWHDDSFLVKYNSSFDMPMISGFNVWWSLLILSLCLILIIFIGIKAIKTVEINDKY